MPEGLTTRELVELVRRVFEPGPDDRGLLVLVDAPDGAAPDHAAWAARRALAADWALRLSEGRNQLGLDRVSLALYRNVGRPNQDLPAEVFLHQGGPLPAAAEQLGSGRTPLDAALTEHQIVLAPTEFSATAPLKLAARRLGFRAATMPGFSAAMIPTLRLDWVEIERRCQQLKARLDAADEALLVFETSAGRSELLIDLRRRSAHASGGLLRERGVAGNLPSGETYIAPYEGERPDEPSRTHGAIPIQINRELLVVRLERNRVVDVKGDGPAAAAERAELAAEPACGNLAELGLGLLRDYGIQPLGELLLDEKLGLHLAFGRSDHFGGAVGPAAWRDPRKVVHLDRVFIPEVMPDVRVGLVDLILPDGARDPLIRDDQYV